MRRGTATRSPMGQFCAGLLRLMPPVAASAVSWYLRRGANMKSQTCVSHSLRTREVKICGQSEAGMARFGTAGRRIDELPTTTTARRGLCKVERLHSNEASADPTAPDHAIQKQPACRAIRANGPCRNRTCNLGLKRPLLCQLS